LHEVLPIFSSGSLDDNKTIALFDQAASGPSHTSHGSLNIACDQHVGSSAQEKAVLAVSFGVVEVLQKVHLRLQMVEAFRTNVKSEAVVGLE
jgi:hypothetical protein